MFQVIYLFFKLFFCPILSRNHTGYHPQEELAKFGYMLEQKVNNLRVFLFFFDMLEPIV
jgi:hypothetical protein